MVVMVLPNPAVRVSRRVGDTIGVPLRIRGRDAVHGRATEMAAVPGIAALLDRGPSRRFLDRFGNRIRLTVER